MDDTTKARLMGALLRRLPVPGSRLQQAISLAGLKLENVRTPIVCRDRWGEIDFCVRDAGDLIERHILLQGYFEYHESKAIKARLKPGGTFLDIGANIGWHTLLAARKVGPSGRVIAFEPVSSTYRRLIENVELNGFANVTALQAGLSTRDGSADIFMPEDDNAGGNSLFRSSSGDAAIETVALRRGDDVLRELGIRRVDLCKMDIEGAEPQAIEGLRGSFEAGIIGTLIIEANGEALARSGSSVREMTDALRGFGYTLRDLRRPGQPLPADRDPAPGTNLLCERPS